MIKDFLKNFVLICAFMVAVVAVVMLSISPVLLGVYLDESNLVSPTLSFVIAAVIYMLVFAAVITWDNRRKTL